MVPVQSGFTVYVPVKVVWNKLPFPLAVKVVVVAPFPSKVCVPTSANGPARAVGVTTNPVPVYAKVPWRLALEHPLSAALIVGTMPRASALTAAIVKVVAMVLRFMIISFAFISCSIQGGDSDYLFSFRWYRQDRTAKAATFYNFFCQRRRGWPWAYPLRKSPRC